MLNEDRLEIERMIDIHGLQAFLETLSEICEGKAEHIAANWQDTRLAKRWATFSGHLGILSTKAGGL